MGNAKIFNDANIYMCIYKIKKKHFLQTIRRARNSEWQREWENNTSKLHYIKPRIEEWESAHNSNRQYEVKLSRIRIGHTRLTHGHLMTRNSQRPTCGSATCGNQNLTIKHCLQDFPQWRDSRKKNNNQVDIRLLTGKELWNGENDEVF